MSIECFPRLSPFVARSIWQTLKRNDTESVSTQARVSHPAAHFTATGGSKITSRRLQLIREDIVGIALGCGYSPGKTEGQRTRFDLECSRYLIERAEIPFPEACRRDMWPFFTLCLLPDIAIWRFPIETEARWLGGIRNTFGVLWRRGYLIGADDPELGSGWNLLEGMTQDALVSVIERSGLAANPAMARAIANVWIGMRDRIGQAAMQEVTRQAMKNLVAYRAVVDIDGLPFEDIVQWAQNAFDWSCERLNLA